MEFLKRGKDVIDQAIINVDQSINESKLSTLEVGRTYGPNLKIRLVDQLGNPDPDLVTRYYGEIKDKKAAKRFGTSDLKEYSYWSWRSCGVADVASVLLSYNLFKGNIYELAKEIDSKGGYLHKDKWGRKDIGWKYSSLKEAINDRGLNAEIISRLSLASLLNNISKARLGIVSVKSRGSLGSHMIIVSKFTWNREKSILSIHDPYNLDGKGGNKKISMSEFKNNFLNKGIIVWKD